MFGVTKYHLPLAKPYQWARGTQTARDGLLVQFQSALAVGWGEVALLPNAVVNAASLELIAQQYVAQLGFDGILINPDHLDDATYVAAICQRLDQIECPPAIRCGLTSAAFNWAAERNSSSLGNYLFKLLEEPIESASILSASTELRGDALIWKNPLERIRVNSLIASDEVAQCVQQAARIVANGQTLIKLKCTSDRRHNLAKLDAIKSQFPQVTFRLDPNQSWSEDWIISHLQETKAFGVEYVEEPLPSTSALSFYARIRGETGAFIALDERIRDVGDVINALEQQACDYFVLKLQRLGGIDKFLNIARVLRGQLHRVVLTSNMESSVGIGIGLHCASILRHPHVAHGLATFDFMRADLCTPPTLEYGGYLAVPQKVAPS